MIFPVVFVEGLSLVFGTEHGHIRPGAQSVDNFPQIADGTAICGNIDISRIRKTVGIPSLRIALRIVMENADPSLAKIVIPRP